MNQQDLNQISARGISEQQIEHQLEQIKNGFPFLKLEGAAAIGKGIMAPTAQEVENYEKAWNDYKAEGHKIVKFVPASGSASRMFNSCARIPEVIQELSDSCPLSFRAFIASSTGVP